MSSAACSRCGVEVPAENVTLHGLRCSGQPSQQVACGSSSQGNEDSTAASAAPSTSEVRTEADEPSEQGAPNFAEVRNEVLLDDVELEEQRPSAENASPTEGTWQCSRCTFENSPSNNNCEMCMAASPFPQETDDEEDVIDPSTIARDVVVRQGKDLACMLLTAFFGCIIGSLWGLCTTDSSHIMDSAFFGMAMGTLFGCVCNCRCRHQQQQRDLPVLPLVDPLASRTRPLLSGSASPRLRHLRQPMDGSLTSTDASATEAPRFSRRARQRQSSEERMVNTLVRQHQLLEEMLERMGNMVPHMEPANAHVVAHLPTHIVSAEEVQLTPPEHKACTICIEACSSALNLGHGRGFL
mmetsp:Transcript_76675/g.135894  ORF Transcript_76675/g.135894 Transcript_76675/m.135894 type:complete len:354 (-) Transcript_76675:178-1239(-)